MNIVSILSSAFLYGASAQTRDIFMYIDFDIPDWNSLNGFLQELKAGGVNYPIIAFHTGVPGGWVDAAGIWGGTMTKEDKQDTKDKLGPDVTLSISFGGSNGPDWTQADVKEIANNVCPYAMTDLYDGVDFDLEGLLVNCPEDQVQMIVDMTNECGKSGIGYISHAPQAPYWGLSSGGFCEGGQSEGYKEVLAKTGDLIKKVLIQYYNQDSDYNTYDLLFLNEDFGIGINTAWCQIYWQDTTQVDKLVVAKPFKEGDGGVGFMELSDLNDALCRAEQELGYNNGIAFWMSHANMDLSPIATTCDIGTPISCPASSNPNGGDTGGDTTAPAGDTTAPGADTVAPGGETTAPSGDITTAAGGGDITTAAGGVTTLPTDDTGTVPSYGSTTGAPKTLCATWTMFAAVFICMSVLSRG